MDYSRFDLSEEEKRAGSPTPKSSRILHLLIKGLSIALIILLLPFVTSHCLPLLKPVGESVLLRLWDVLRFIVITTVVSFGIMNSQWKSIQRAHPWKEDDDKYRSAPSLNHSIFNELEQLKIKDDLANDISVENPKIVGPFLVPDDEVASKTQYEACEIAKSERLNEAPVEELQTKAPVNTGIARESAVGYGEEIDARHKTELDLSKNIATEASTDDTTAGSSASRYVSGEKYSRGSAITSISEGLTAVTQSGFRSASLYNEGPIVHRRIVTRPRLNDDKSRRRSSSVDHPLQLQPSRLSISSVADASKAANVDPIVKTQAQPNATPFYDQIKPAPVSNLVVGSRHSRSAVNLDRLNQNQKIPKSSRRNTSFSCDFGDDYSPEWFIDYPPTPPLTDPSDSETEASSPIAKTSCSPSVKAVSLSLGQCGLSSPVDIAPSSNSSDTHSPPAAALLEERAPTSVSPSPGELNKKADAFIARFYEHIRMQRVESFERRRSRARSTTRGYNY